MSGEYYTLVTDIGHAKLTSALALGRAVTLTHFALGDGNGQVYNPIQSQTALAREVYRTAINAIRTDAGNPSWLTVEAVIPADVGGWTIREAGIVDADGDLIAVAKYPESVKPVLSSGVGKDLYCRLILEHGNVNAVTLKIDPAVVLATGKDLSAALDDHASDRRHPHPGATTSARGLVRLANKEESIAGVANDAAVTPATLAAAVEARRTDATETEKGLVRLATLREAGEPHIRDAALSAAGVNDWWQRCAPRHLNNPGWHRLPGGLIMQWGVILLQGKNRVTIKLPIAYPNSVFGCWAVEGTDDINASFCWSASYWTHTTVLITNSFPDPLWGSWLTLGC